MMDTGASAEVAAAAADDAGWIRALGFAPRKESWVAAADDHFYKLFRAGDDPAHDWLDPACGRAAAREYADMRVLHAACAEVLQPERRDHACIVYPHLSGPDLRAALLRGDAAGAAGPAAALRVLARLHAHDVDLARYPRKDYIAAGYLHPDLDVLRRLAERPRQLCMEGFEARNFRYDQRRQAWCFFDPQGVSLGVAENDVARFIVSLLMLHWGRGGAFRIWTAFDARELLATYEHAAARTLDATLLNYFVYESIAMRRHFAERALRGLRGARRVLGRPYLATYFHQLEKWAKQHEF